jgi:hypothetical protein
MTGVSFTAQVQRPLVGGDPSGAGGYECFKYTGGKVTKWSLKNDVDGILTCDLSADFAAEVTGATYVAPTFSTGAYEPLTFVGGTVNINAVQYAVKNVSLECETPYATDRFFINNSTTKKEPLENEYRKATLGFEVDFDSASKALYTTNVVAGTAVSNVVLKWTGRTLIGATTYPSVQVTLPYVRLDDDTPAVDGMDLVGLQLKGAVLDSSDANGPVQFQVITGESNAVVIY